MTEADDHFHFHVGPRNWRFYMWRLIAQVFGRRVYHQGAFYGWRIGRTTYMPNKSYWHPAMIRPNADRQQ